MVVSMQTRDDVNWMRHTLGLVSDKFMDYYNQ